ncbi:MAG: ATP-grasp domain-containing protein [Bacillota bacterium]|jgi:ribosomal protein S6--L-glutamate ligase|nr:ATP-grasp domain-containing protein [Bacillota bacterium]NLL60316.1 ATP-grasp domain-containing protein [Tissierellia bacterium]
MTIAILYESEEWSNIYLRDYIRDKGCEVMFVNFEKAVLNAAFFDSAALLVNRIFPSSYFRGHLKTYFKGIDFLREINKKGIPMINSFEALMYDFDKRLVCNTLRDNKINTPEIYCTTKDFSLDKIKFPCIVKPNSGGRSRCTAKVENPDELLEFLKTLPPIEFIFQEYIKSIDNYTLRIEAINGEVFSAVKRSMDENGISSYHRGAVYEKDFKLDKHIEDLVIDTLDILNIRMGGIDLIISNRGPNIVDVNATSNFSKEFVDFLQKNPLNKMGDLIINEYFKITKSVS